MEVMVKSVSAQRRAFPRRVWEGRRSYMTTTWRRFDGKPRLYVGVADENILENFAYRENRPHTLYRKLLPEIFAALKLPEGTKATWSRNAGCSMCPCSPGFILTVPETRRSNLTLRRVRRIDFYATLVGEAAKVGEITDRVRYRAQRGVEVLVEGRL